MPQIEVKVPQLSESVSEATLVSWRKKAGDAVKRDENLIDIETDKVVLELPAPADGVIARIIKGDGESVASGEVIAVLDTEAKPAAGAAAGATDERAAPPAQAQAQSTPAKTGASGASAPAAPVAPAPSAAAGAASPAARKIAAEQGVDTSKVAGSGRDGR